MNGNITEREHANEALSGSAAPVPLMTAEEEEALLAEYGVQGPYDELLEVAAPSQFRSELGDANVFLTGAIAEEEGGDGATKQLDIPCEELLRFPLDFLMVKYTEAHTALAPPSLAHHIGSTLDKLRTAATPHQRNSRGVNDRSVAIGVTYKGAHDEERAPRRLSDMDYRDVLRQGKAMERRAQHLCQGTTTTDVQNVLAGQLSETVDDEDSALREADALLQRAHEYAAGTSNSCDSRHADVLERVQQARRVADLLSTDNYDNFLDRAELFEDDDEAALIRETRERADRCLRLMEQLAKEDDADGAVSPQELRATSERELPPPSPVVSATNAPAVTVASDPLSAEETLRRELLTIPRLSPLFAFEFQATNEELAELAEWDQLVEVESQAPTETPSVAGAPEITEDATTAHATLPTEAEREAILYSIATIVERDHNLESLARSGVKTALREHRSEAATADAIHQDRAQHGYIALDVFEKRADALIEPIEEELTARRRLVAAEQAPSTAGIMSDPPLAGESDAVSPIAPASSQSLASIQRAARLEMLLIRREAEEARSMRSEDARVVAWHRNCEAHVESIRELLGQCVEDCQLNRRGVATEEVEAYESLCGSAELDRQHALRRIALRKVQAEAKLAQDVMTEHTVLAQALQSEEEAERAGLHRLEQHASQSVRERLAEKQAAEERAATERVRQYHAAYVAERQRRLRSDCGDAVLPATTRREVPPFTPNIPDPHTYMPSSEGQCDDDGPSLRLQVLAAERARLTSWVQSNSKTLATLITTLMESLQQFLLFDRRRPSLTSTHQHHPGDSRPGSPSGVISSRPSTSLPTPGGSGDHDSQVKLDDKMMSRLLAQSISATMQEPHRASQYFGSVSFALEGIEVIDLPSLAAMEIPSSTLSDSQRRWTGERGVQLCGLVRELDLGSNQLTELSLLDLLRTFPRLRRLQLSGNQLLELGAGSGSAHANAARRKVAAAAENAIAESLQVTDLDVSSNCLTNLDSVGVYLSGSVRRIAAYANRLETAAPLMRCRHLHELLLNHNSLRTLDGVSSLPLLQELNVSGNALANVDELVAGNLLLQKLFVSQNQLTTLPAPLQFITQLFVNHNRLEVLDTRTCSGLPMLSVLHAEGNQLTDISGLSQCPRLALVKLSFNQLQSVAALRPLRACRRVSSLDVTANPLASSVTLSAPNSGEPSLPLPDTVRDAILSFMPNLAELNNEAVTPIPPQSRHCAVSPASPLRAFQWLRGGGSAHAALIASSPSLAESYSATMNSLCADVFVTDMRTRLEVQQLYAQRRLRAAEAVETRLRESMATSHHLYVPAVHTLSVEVAVQSQRAWLRSLADSVGAMKGFDGTDHRFTNLHVACPTYAEKSRESREAEARRRIGQWLCGVALVRRARKELCRLQVEYMQSRAYRMEMAALRIQPVWRGAVLRVRLKRILYPSQDGGSDSDEFAKVDEDFLMEDTEPAGVGSILQRVMNRHEPAPSFDVPTVMPTFFRSGFANITDVSGTPPRVGSAPAVEQSQLSRSGRPHSLSTNGGVSTATGDPKRTQAQALEEQWGSTVAARIQKKNKKMAQVRQQHVRQEFLKDPLKVKRDIGSGRNI